eukprot:252451-Rhodomonas_salina.1
MCIRDRARGVQPAPPRRETRPAGLPPPPASFRTPAASFRTPRLPHLIHPSAFSCPTRARLGRVGTPEHRGFGVAVVPARPRVVHSAPPRESDRERVAGEEEGRDCTPPRPRPTRSGCCSRLAVAIPGDEAVLDRLCQAAVIHTCGNLYLCCCTAFLELVCAAELDQPCPRAPVHARVDL